MEEIYEKPFQVEKLRIFKRSTRHDTHAPDIYIYIQYLRSNFTAITEESDDFFWWVVWKVFGMFYIAGKEISPQYVKK